jgi:chromosome segregation ATPase
MEEIEKLKSKGQLSKGVKISGQEVLDLINEREDLTAKIENLGKKVAGLEAKTLEAESRVMTYEAEKGNLEGLTGEMTKEVEAAKAQVAQYSQALTAAQDLISSREDEMNKLTAELDNLRNQVGGMSAMDQQISSLQGQVGQMQTKDQEIARLKAEINAEKQRAASLEAEVAQAAAAQNSIKQLNQQLAQMQLELNNRPSAAEVEKRDQQISNLTGQLGSLNSTIAQLHEEISSKDARIKELSQPQAVFEPSIVSKAAPVTPTFSAPSPPESVMAAHELGRLSPSPAAEPSAPMPSMGGSGRRVCPNCGSSQIKETEDRTRIVSYIPKPMYAKNFVCRKCSYEFT